MSDKAWKEAWRAIEPLLRAQDKLLLPRGSWKLSSLDNIRFYDNKIDLEDANLFLLHKGKMGGIKKQELKNIFLKWRIIFSNNVFVLFKRKKLFFHSNNLLLPKHVRSVNNYLNSKKKKRNKNTAFFVHLPKTAGTTAWENIGMHVPSKLYYENYHSFLANPPASYDYDLVGGHIPLPLMSPYIRPDDVVLCLVREPISRFRSAFLHSRRPHEDPATFSPVMRAMREMPLKDFLMRPDARMEVCQQFFMLGFGFDRIYEPSLDDVIFKRIIEYVSNPTNVFMTSELVDTFIGYASTLLQAPPLPFKDIQNRNVSDQSSQSSDMIEFNACLDDIRSMNNVEERVYRLIKDQQEIYLRQ